MTQPLRVHKTCNVSSLEKYICTALLCDVIHDKLDINTLFNMMKHACFIMKYNVTQEV